MNMQSNYPCPCGSGKKYKKCCKDKRPRIPGIDLDFGPINISELDRLPSGEYLLGDMSRFLSRASLGFTMSYPRIGKSPKTIIKIPIESNWQLKPVEDYFSSFDFVVAVDTNTKMKDNQKLSCTVASTCRINRKGNRMSLDLWPIYRQIFIDVEDPEKTGWISFIQEFCTYDCYSAGIKVGLIVDHDSGKIQQFNRKEIPVLGDVYLPSGFTLTYATSDVSDYLPNKLISFCDKESNRVLSNVVSDENKPIGVF